MRAAPEGTVTLLFSDIEGSTSLVRRLAEGYAGVLLEHRRLLREAFEARGGYEVGTEGDSFFVAFASAREAVEAAADAQRALAAHDWSGDRVWVRMGLHTGEPRLLDGSYVGIDVHHAARVMAAGHGGQVLISQSTRDLVGDGVGVRDLGVHRLKDIPSPQRLFQLVVDGLPLQFPPLKTLTNRPSNLPVQATPLIGRKRELLQVAALLKRDDVRLLTLTGPGGTGKTRLALATAAKVLDEFDDGVFFVGLASVADPALVVPSVARALGLREEPGRPVAETLAQYVSERSMLLLVDNLEHVREAAQEMSALLASAPGLRVLATSRSPLRVSAEHLYEVPALALPELNHGRELAAIARTEAVRLFVARAEAVRGDFKLTADNAASVAEICLRLDGLPLAIELAAARTRELSPPALLERLRERLKLLTGGGRDVEDRQRSLQATIAWSFELLPDAAQVLFARLAAFAGGCRPDAAEVVCSPSGELGIDVFDGLSSLVAESLLKQRDDFDGEPRFWMLATIREFAFARLAEIENTAEGAASPTQLRHAIEMAELAERLDPLLRAADSETAIERFEAEHPNIRAALDYTSEVGPAELMARLVGATDYFWGQRGYLSEGLAYAAQAVKATASEPDDVRLPALRALAGLLAQSRDHNAARPIADEVEKISVALGDPQKLLWALHLQSYIAGTAGDVQASIAFRQRCLDLAHQVDDKRFQMVCTLNLGDLALKEGRYAEAVALSEEAFRAAHELGVAAAADALANRASALLALGDTQGALEGFVATIERCEASHIVEPIGWAANGLAAIALQKGAPTDAALLLAFVEAFLAKTGYALEGFELRQYEQANAAARQQLDSATLNRKRNEGMALARDSRHSRVLEAIDFLGP